MAYVCRFWTSYFICFCLLLSARWASSTGFLCTLWSTNTSAESNRVCIEKSTPDSFCFCVNKGCQRSGFGIVWNGASCGVRSLAFKSIQFLSILHSLLCTLPWRPAFTSLLLTAYTTTDVLWLFCYLHISYFQSSRAFFYQIYIPQTSVRFTICIEKSTLDSFCENKSGHGSGFGEFVMVGRVHRAAWGVWPLWQSGLLNLSLQSHFNFALCLKGRHPRMSDSFLTNVLWLILLFLYVYIHMFNLRGPLINTRFHYRDPKQLASPDDAALKRFLWE